MKKNFNNVLLYSSENSAEQWAQDNYNDQSAWNDPARYYAQQSQWATEGIYGTLAKLWAR